MTKTRRLAMSAEQSALLADSRCCNRRPVQLALSRTHQRSVSQSPLGYESDRLVAGASVALTVHPDMIVTRTGPRAP